MDTCGGVCTEAGLTAGAAIVAAGTDRVGADAANCIDSGALLATGKEGAVWRIGCAVTDTGGGGIGWVRWVFLAGSKFRLLMFCVTWLTLGACEVSEGDWEEEVGWLGVKFDGVMSCPIFDCVGLTAGWAK